MKYLLLIAGAFFCVAPAFPQIPSAEFARLVALNKCDEVAAGFVGAEPSAVVTNITDLRIKSVEMLKVLYGGMGDRILSDQDKDGVTLLMLCVQNGQADCVEFLLSKGASVNRKDSYGRTALYLSGGNIDGACAEILIKYGAYVDSQNCNGVTPLMFAIREGNISVVKELLSAGANPKLRDCVGGTALTRAMAEPVADYVSNEAIDEIRALLSEQKGQAEGGGSSKGFELLGHSDGVRKKKK